MEKITVLKKTEAANSFEFGKAVNRHKVYYETLDELKEKLEGLRAMGLIDEDGQNY